MKQIASGELDRRIQIQSAVFVKDSAGDPVPEWSDRFKLWAMKAAQRGFEQLAAQQLVRQADTVFTIRDSARNRTIFPEDHRVTFQGQIFEIVGVQPSKSRNDAIELLTASRPDGHGARARGDTDGV